MDSLTLNNQAINNNNNASGGFNQTSDGCKTIIKNMSLASNRNNLNGSNLSEKIKLERILGLTVCGNSALDSDPTSSSIAYVAGCVAVLYNVQKNKQRYIINASKKTLTCLSFSSDGQYLITGECGHQPCVRIFDVATGTQVTEFAGHKYGINCVAFSPNMKLAVSVGSQHDMIVNVWDWRSGIKVASNKVSAKVKALSFASDGSYFVTVGNRHVKFWYLDYSRSRINDAMPLMGRSAILGEQRNNNFCDVACGRHENTPESTYAITESGLLCEFNNRRLLDKWVELRTTSANCLSVGVNYICVGCADGIVRVFNPSNLHFVCTLPRPHSLGIDLAKGLVRNDVISNNQDGKYADCLAITLDEQNSKVSCVYKDHSLYIWDIRDVKRVGKSQSFLFHSACIWSVETYPVAKHGAKALLPNGTFITCSSDDTIRLWNLEPNNNQLEGSAYKRNIFSDELLKIFYTDPELTYISEDINAATSDKNETSFDGRNGVRCIRVAPDGRKLASGDRAGNVRVYDLQRQEEVCKIEAHDSEVLCVEYSPPDLKNGSFYLSSASRDRLIHLFDVNKEYAFVQTLDDHTASITATKFVLDAEKAALQLISCGADRSVIFRKMNFDQNESNFSREHYVVGKTTFYDMEYDRQNSNVLTACQDRLIRVYNTQSGKYVNGFKGSTAEDGTLIKIAFDPTGTYLATSSTDKVVNIYHYQTGKCLLSTSGHSEVITGLTFAQNGRHLISVSGDSCVFVWRLPSEISNAITSKLGLPPAPPEKPAHIVSMKPAVKKADSEIIVKPAEEQPSLQKSGTTSSALPSWAKKQMREDGMESSSGESEPHTSLNIEPNGATPSKNRWASRIESTQNLVVKSYLSTDPVITYPQTPNESANSKSESSKASDGSVEDGHSPKQPSSIEDNERRPATEAKANGDSNGIIYYAPEQENPGRSLSFQVQQYEDQFKNGKPIRNGSSGSAARFGKRSNMRLMPSVSVPNFNELHSDDEEADVAGKADGDKTTKNPIYMSTENLDLDRLDHRSSFLKNTFDLEERDAKVSPRSNGGDHQERSSLSAKHAKHISSSASKAPAAEQPGSHGNDLNQPEAASLSRTPSGSIVKKPPLSQRREDLTKAISEARERLETLGWRRGNALSNSKSIADISGAANYSNRVGTTRPPPTTLSQQSDAVRRSISLSDLAPQRKLFSIAPAAGAVAAPLWDQNSKQSDSSTTSSQDANTVLKKSTSISSLTKEPLSMAKLQLNSRGLGPWGTPSPLASNSSTPIRQLRSGRSSAPLQGGVRKSVPRFAGDSSDDESSSSESGSPFGRLHRPGTPPKPSILRQIRRSSTSQTIPTAQQPPNKASTDVKPPKTRRLWDNFELRSSKSEYNLSFVGRDSVTPKRLSSASSTRTLWSTPAENTLDLGSRYQQQPQLRLTKENVLQLLEELNTLAHYARQLHNDALATGNQELGVLLAEGVSRTYQNLAQIKQPMPAVDPAALLNLTPQLGTGAGLDESAASLPPEAIAAQTMNLLQAYSSKLLTIVEKNFEARSKLTPEKPLNATAPATTATADNV